MASFLMPNYVKQYDLGTHHIISNGYHSSTSAKTLRGDSVNEAGQGTSTRVGDATANRPTTQTTMQTLPQTNPKRSMDSACSSDSSTSATSNSSNCVINKKKKRKKRIKEPTENHLKLRAACDAGRKWELDLEEVHGLTDELACVVVSLMAPHLKKDTFPPANGNPLMKHAEEGWKLLKEARRLGELYPDCGDQTCINWAKNGKCFELLIPDPAPPGLYREEYSEPDPGAGYNHSFVAFTWRHVSTRKKELQQAEQLTDKIISLTRRE